MLARCHIDLFDGQAIPQSGWVMSGVADDAGRPAAGVTDELRDRRAAVAELAAELRALADLVTRTEAGAGVLRDCARQLREVSPGPARAHPGRWRAGVGG